MSTTNRAVLAGVVAVVSCTDGATKEAITNKLQRCGARVASRLSNDVTHVVFKGRGLTVNSRAEQERDLWDVYCMIDKLERPPVVVSPLWLEACIKEQMRAQEHTYMLPRPKNNPTWLTNAATPGSSGKRKQRPKAFMPKNRTDYERNASDVVFSSSQQIAHASTGPVEVNSPSVAHVLKRPKTAPAAVLAGKPRHTAPHEKNNIIDLTTPGAAGGGVKHKTPIGTTGGGGGQKTTTTATTGTVHQHTHMRHNNTVTAAAAVHPPTTTAAAQYDATASHVLQPVNVVNPGQHVGERAVRRVITFTSVDDTVQMWAGHALRKMRGARLFVEGSGDRVTHVIVGLPRRTLKVLLGIAHGAWLVSSAWLDACVTSASWVEETPYLVDGPWPQAAAKARAALHNVNQPTTLLHGWDIHIAGTTPNATGANVLPLRRLVTALGGKVVPASQCSVCVLTGPVLPQGLMLKDGCACVTEEWLLDSVTCYQLQPVECYAGGGGTTNS